MKKDFRKLVGHRGRYLIRKTNEGFRLYKRYKKCIKEIPLVLDKYYPVWRQRHLIKYEPKQLPELWKKSGGSS